MGTACAASQGKGAHPIECPPAIAAGYRLLRAGHEGWRDAISEAYLYLVMRIADTGCVACVAGVCDCRLHAQVRHRHATSLGLTRALLCQLD